ncbi:hypothetical protein PO909_021501 [Leuciscus waleckii]
MVSCGSSFNVDDVTSPTPNPVPSQNPSVGIMQFEPTADVEPFSSANSEPTPSGACVPNIDVKPGMHQSDQVRVPAAPSTAEGAVMESEGNEESPAQPPATESIALAAPLSALQLDDSSSVLSVPPCLPLPPPHQIILEDLVLIIGLFLSLRHRPQPSAIPVTHLSPSPTSPSGSTSGQLEAVFTWAIARVLVVTPSTQTFSYAVGSQSSVIASGRRPGGCGLGTCHHAPAQGSSLALTTFCNALDPSVLSPPGQPSSA